jgi:long-subunit fatty acid transport protein
VARATLAILAVFVTCGSAQAGGSFMPDIGVRRLGMLAVVGRPDDVTAVFHNPAGLTLQKGTHLYHSQSWFLANLKLRLYDSKGVLRPDHEISPDWNVGAIPFLGVASDLGTQRWRLAFAVYAPNAYGAALPKDEPTRYHATRVLFLAPRVATAVAYQVSEKLSVAATVNLVVSYLSASRLMNAAVLADPDRRFDPVEETRATDFEARMKGVGVAWSLDAGVLFHPTPTLSLGAAFAGGSDVHLKGPISVHYPDGTSESTTQHTHTVIPFTLRAGFNWEFAPDFELGMDVYYWHYQVLQEQRVTFDAPIAGLTGLVDPKGFGNSWDWNIGLMYHLAEAWAFLCGFQMDFTPIPTQAFSLDNPSRDLLGVSAGLRWDVSPHWRVGAALMQNWFHAADVQDSVSTPPSNAKGHGGNAAFAVDVSYAF